MAIVVAFSSSNFKEGTFFSRYIRDICAEDHTGFFGRIVTTLFYCRFVLHPSISLSESFVVWSSFVGIVPINSYFGGQHRWTNEKHTNGQMLTIKENEKKRPIYSNTTNSPFFFYLIAARLS